MNSGSPHPAETLFPTAILAGGRATRLGALSKNTPKALIEVAGRPFIYRQVDKLRDQGITDVVICSGYLGDQIEAAVGDGADFGVRVRYSWDGLELLGTGGALKKALPLLGDSFFVTYGDAYLQCNYAEVQQRFRSLGKPALMTTFRNGGRWGSSNVRMRDGTLLEYNKQQPAPDMEYIDYGLSLISSAALREYPSGTRFDLGDFFHDLSVAGQLAAFEVTERFYEVGSPLGLEEASRYFRNHDNG